MGTCLTSCSLPITCVVEFLKSLQPRDVRERQAGCSTVNAHQRALHHPHRLRVHYKEWDDCLCVCVCVCVRYELPAIKDGCNLLSNERTVTNTSYTARPASFSAMHVYLPVSHSSDLWIISEGPSTITHSTSPPIHVVFRASPSFSHVIWEGQSAIYV